jgi:hypothetical protein
MSLPYTPEHQARGTSGWHGVISNTSFSHGPLDMEPKAKIALPGSI